METTKEVRVMHPDVYDTLEFGALAFGGIGAAQDFEHTFDFRSNINCPVCVWGYTATAEENADSFGDFMDRHGSDGELRNPIARELQRLVIWRSTNDTAVSNINAKRSKAGAPYYDPWARVTFKKWAKEIGVVRGNPEDFPELQSDVVAENQRYVSITPF